MDISVVIPVYNGEKNLAQTLDSVLRAIGKIDGEIVLINDGSKDSSEEICLRYAEKHRNIIYEKKENGGIVSARNRGLEMAKADYICFCDQDDIVRDDMYALLLEKVRQTGAPMGFCGTGRYVDGKYLDNELFEDAVYRDDEVAKNILIPILFYGTTLGRPISERWVGTIWKGIFSRKLINEKGIRFRRFVNYEDDLLFFLEVLTSCETVFTMSYVGYYWRINSESETYNWKYIEDIDIKSERMWNDIISMAGRMISDEELFQKYRQYQICHMYDQFIINEGSIHNPGAFRTRIKRIKNVIRKYGEDNLRFRSNIVPEYRRTRIILTLLSVHMYSAAYLFNIWYKKKREFKNRSKA